MTMVDDGVAGPGLAAGAHAHAASEHGHAPSEHGRAAGRAPAVPVPCAARPGAGLAHLDGPCQCFFGGPPPVFLDRSRRAPSVHDGHPAQVDRTAGSHHGRRSGQDVGMPTYLAVVTVHGELVPDEVTGMADALGARQSESDAHGVRLWVPGEAPDLPTATQAARQHAAEVLDGYRHEVEVHETPAPGA